MARQYDPVRGAASDALCPAPAARRPRDPVAGDSFAPKNWNRLGRRVLVEAWRRFTEDLAPRPSSGSPPVVPVPSPEETP